MPSAPDENGLVVFTAGDPDDAKNWSKIKKNMVIVQTCILSFAAGFGSPIFGPEEVQLIERFNISEVTADSGLAVFVLGFSFGPMFWGPMSEYYGRRLPYVVSWILLIASSAPSAFVNNVPVIIIFRFIAGCCAACAQNNPLGYYSDMFGSKDGESRKKAMAAYSLAFCAGPMLAIPVGFLILASSGSVDWVMRFYFFFVVALLPVALMLPESHGPTILASRAKEMRKAGVMNARSSQDLEQQSLRKIFSAHIIRPFDMLTREPIAMGCAIWNALGSGLVYLYFEIFPFLFLEKYHFSLAHAGLPFLSLLIGIFLAVVLAVILNKYLVPWRIPFFQPVDASPDSPEAHLKASLLGCILMPASLFWFAWTSDPNIHWIVPTLSGVVLATSIFLLFMSFVSYITHTYTIFANSANACNSFLRSFASFALAIASHKIVNTMGYNWGVSLFAFLSFGLVPIPLIFLRYGEKLRSRSYYANEAARVLSELNASTTADTGNLSVEKVYSQGIEEGSDKASGDGSEMA